MIPLQSAQAQFYTVKRLAINKQTGECSALLSPFVPHLPSIVCKLKVAPAGFNSTRFDVKFDVLVGDFSISQATEIRFRLAISALLIPWLDRVGFSPIPSGGILL